MSAPRRRPLLVVGVSGVGWDLLDVEIEAGRMPNLARLRERGTSLPLRSERVAGDAHFRPQVAWATLATGCSAERHGITRYFYERDDLREPALWDHWQRAGGTVGVYGWPGTWPPPPSRGFVVPSHLARDARTWPPGLAPLKAIERAAQEAEREPSARGRARAGLALARVLVGQPVSPGARLRLLSIAGRAAVADAAARRLELRRAKLELGADVFLGLCRRFRPDCAAFVTFYVDLALHRFWRAWQPHVFGPGWSDVPPAHAGAIPRALADLDRVLGRLLPSASPDAVVAFVSEHGMAPEPDPAEVGDRYYAIRGERVLELVGLGGRARPCPVARWIAYRPAAGGRLPDDLRDRLAAVTVVESEAPLFAVHEHGPDEIVIKLRLTDDLAAGPGGLDRLRVRFGADVVPFAQVTRRLGPIRSAMHAEEAALALAGPGIRRGARLEAAPLVDVLPTLIGACGLPPVAGLDGVELAVFD